jgi:RNA polymerase sigma-70 factor (ECF subfamily)
MTTNLETIWEQFAAKLRSFIRSRIRDHAAAEDVLQDVFLVMHKQLPALRADDRLEAWIWRITRNAIAGHYRRSRRNEPLPDDFEQMTADEPDLPDLKGCIRGYVRQLEPEFREALLLTEWRAVSQKEMARRLGLSDSGAKSRVQRARQKVKQMLLACCELELDRRGTVVEMRRRGRGKKPCVSSRCQEAR